MAKDNPEQHYEEFHDTVNMTVSELEAFGESDNFDIYEEQKNAGQPIDEPRNDVIRLLETPKDDWSCDDDGFNECEQSDEVDAFVGRMSEAEQGDPMPGTDPELSRRDASLLNWGFDPNQGKDFEGDRQR